MTSKVIICRINACHRKGKTQVEVILDLKLILVQNAILNFPPEHAKALERRINIIPCEYYVEKRTLH